MGALLSILKKLLGKAGLFGSILLGCLVVGIFVYRKKAIFGFRVAAIEEKLGISIGLVLIIIGAIGLLILIIWGLRLLRQQQLARRLQPQATPATPAAPNEEVVRQLRQKVLNAIKRFRQMQNLPRRAGPKHYAVPWYILLGADAPGKTTLLQNVANLHFQLSWPEDFRAGTTADCEWWFFDDKAVLIDTASDFVSAEGTDGQDTPWFHLLRLLKRYRKLEPINGIVLAVAMDTLIRYRT
ncbi:hypothetical protein C2W62_27810 [Candidatus Entotheonella serta]|nr:hypothetical protein C2W62_27810 [Candidatus Entotheonella serta]